MIKSRRLVNKEKDGNHCCANCGFLTTDKKHGIPKTRCKIDGCYHGGQYGLHDIICDKYKEEE